MQLAATAVHVSTGWKWSAAGIGLSVIALMWLVVGVSSPKIRWRFWRVTEGFDGRLSTSKFQWFVWLHVIIFAYTTLWVVRAVGGDYSAISRVPGNVLVVLGLSATTAVAAKSIRVAQLPAGSNVSVVDAAAQEPSKLPGGLLQDDAGFPELGKIQMIGFTIIAVGIFLATLVHQLHGNPVHTELPNIDATLLALMGLSQGGYLGKKLASTKAPP